METARKEIFAPLLPEVQALRLDEAMICDDIRKYDHVVYAVTRSGVVVYVGCTYDLSSRITSHQGRFNNGKFQIIATTRNRASGLIVETALIKFYRLIGQCKLNKVINTVPRKGNVKQLIIHESNDDCLMVLHKSIMRKDSYAELANTALMLGVLELAKRHKVKLPQTTP